MTGPDAVEEVVGGDLSDSGRSILMPWPIAAIIESPLNPRQHYDAHALEELTQSLQRSGQITPGLARPHDGSVVRVDDVLYPVVELAAGHRRFRALSAAGAATMRLEIREMADEEFIEVLQVENLQRDDLTPLEEAQGYRLLMDRIGYDIGRIADRVGRTRSYVYDRLKLLRLIEPAQELLAARRFELGHAVLLARLSPEDQARAMASDRSGNGRHGGLFVHENVGLFRTDQEERESEEALESPDPVTRSQGLKPVSVREFKRWIDEHVRFRPEAEDLPELFPATAEALAAAAEAEVRVVKITRHHRASDEAKDPAERTYGNQSWRRADGEVAEPCESWEKPEEPATCEHSVMGVVVAGPGRGEAFMVCVAKKVCAVHWGVDIRAAKKRAKQMAGASPAERKAQEDANRKARLERERQDEEARKRWEKARPAILEAVVEKLRGAVADLAGPIALSIVRGWIKVPEALKGGTAEHVIRQIAYAQISDGLRNAWVASKEWPKVVGPLGIDAKRIVEEVAGNNAAAQPKAKPKPAKGKRLAGDVRRAKSAKKAAS